MITRLFSYTRYLLVIPVLGALIASVTILLFGGAETVRTIATVLDADAMVPSSKALLLKYIEIIDLFLIGTVFYITALGLYELFIDENVPTPAWLHITHLDDLKSKLLGVIVLILMVVFLGRVINWDTGWDVLILGASIGFVVVAVTYYLRATDRGHQ
jgi:uncharacterized membrane protein YqhA